MPDFDDEEYESFELEGKGGRTPTATTGVVEGARTPTATTGVVEVDDDLEDVDDDDDDELEDATEDEIDFVLAAYREDGQPYVQELVKDLANDLDELIVQLRRLPGTPGRSDSSAWSRRSS
jgi:hypothetical protein